MQVELRIKNGFEGLMNAMQRLSLKKLPDLIEHQKAEKQRLMNGFLDERKINVQGEV